jgi:hypothetical protein
MITRTVLNTAVTGHGPQNGKIIRHIASKSFRRGKSIIIGHTVPLWYGQSCHSECIIGGYEHGTRPHPEKVVQKKGYLNGRCDNDMSPGEASGMIRRSI